MKRIVFLPDRPVDADGDLFRSLVQKLGLANFEIDGDPDAADFVAYIGRERATERFGKVRTGRIDERTYVLPSTAPEHRGRFFEGIWTSFASHVLGRDLAVRDEYKGMAPEEIKRALDAKRFDFGVLVANVTYDINLGSIVRSSNAFLAGEVVIYGRRKMDMRGAMGAHVYENVTHVGDIQALRAHIAERGYTAVCFETEGVCLSEFVWPERPLMMFGQEGPGVPDELRACADSTVCIPQFGSMRSINVGVAAGIAMYDWHAKRIG